MGDVEDLRNDHEVGQVDKRRHYLEPEHLNEIPLWIAPCHLVAAIFQIMQSLFLFAFSSQINMRWLVYTNYPTRDIALLGVTEYAKPQPIEIGAFNISWLAAAFIVMSGIDHILCILPVTRNYYKWYVQRNQSPFRWYEYSVSAALMRVLISMIAGVTDVTLLVAIFFLTNCMINFGIMHERLNGKALADGYKQDWTPFWMSWVAQIVAWVIIFLYYVEKIKGANSPAYIGFILIVLFVLDGGFALVHALQWLKIGVFKDYMVGEFFFIILSFTSKTFLAWVITAGGANNRH